MSMNRIMAMDFGTVRIGIAVSDPLGMTAQPLAFVSHHTGPDQYQALVGLIKDWEIDEIIVGLPLNMNGTEGALAVKAREFAEQLQEIMQLPVKMWDERLTTREADKLMIAHGVRRDRRKQKRDSLAATLLLQNYLDSIKH
jgi:putative holliday junction resolvase